MPLINEVADLRRDVNTIVAFVEEISKRLMEFSEDLKTMKSKFHDSVFDSEYEISNLKRDMEALEERVERVMNGY